MDKLVLLQKIRSTWFDQVVEKVAPVVELRETFLSQVDDFYLHLEKAVSTDDPSWMDNVLYPYATSVIQLKNEISNGCLIKFINEIMSLLFIVAFETLDQSESLDLFIALLPSYTYLSEKASQYEVDNQIELVTNRLTQVQLNLEKINQTKSDFIVVAAHELKTPLTLITGYTAMLQESLKRQGLSENDNIMVDGILTGTSRLQAIVDNMIDVSLIDNNLLQLNFQPIWVNRIITSLRFELDVSIKERNQRFLSKDFPGSDNMSYGDPERLLQAFRNIIINAIKYTPDGGEISITGRKLPGFIEVIVHDTGIGIATELQPIIFEKFFRVGDSSLHSSGKTKFKGGGPGLGLHIAKGIIEAHGGTIWVESPGYDEINCPGSDFHILLPYHTQPPKQKMTTFFKDNYKTNQ